jgi:L-cysteine/cystine lyase
MTFAAARAQFPVCDTHAYLNAGTFGPLSRGTAGAVTAELEAQLRDGRSSLERYERTKALREEIRVAIGRLVAVEDDRLALTTSTSEGCAIVLNGLRLGPDDEIVTTDVEHFGMLGPIHASGARVRFARLRDRPAATAQDVILAEIGPRTKLIAVSHVSWLTGQVLDVHALTAAAGGIPVLVDGAQSAGAVPFSAAGLDFYTVSCQKWLCGPDPTGALVVRDAESLAVAWPSYAGMLSFDESGWEPKPGAARFEAVSHALPALAGLAHALTEAPAWRFERALAAAADCRERLLAAGVDVVTEAAQGTLVSFRAPGGDAPAAAARAAEERVVIRALPGTDWIRASCGYWTSDEDLERLVAAVAA